LASGVLHNVKNVMNSVNVSIDVIGMQLKQSKSASLEKVTALLREHSGDLGNFITEHPKGKLLPQYLEQLAQQLAREHEAVLGELRELEKSAQHIKEIVTTQQNCAKGSESGQKVKPADLMEDSLRIVSAGLSRHGVQVVREFDAKLPEITVEKHKVLQILVNFIRNAKEACDGSAAPEKKVILRATNGGEFVHLSVTDNGAGIAPENLANLFHRGFTTKKDGHGFGLHSSARFVRELGGDIEVKSDGPGTGATFSIKLPICLPATN
jgi:C4-dicarboxylate-specific signal transduction histidine kinase